MAVSEFEDSHCAFTVFNSSSVYTSEYIQLCDRTLTTNPITAGAQMKEMEFSHIFLHKSKLISKMVSEEICVSVVLHYVAALIRQSRLFSYNVPSPPQTSSQ